MSERIPEQVDALHRNPSAMIDEVRCSAMRTEIERLKFGEPFQYVMGNAHFFGMSLAVDQRVLIPRPETEEMLGMITSQTGFEPATIVDACTGSGCIALGLKKSFPSARVIALDLDAGALELAVQNAISNRMEVDWRVKDILNEGWSDELPAQSHLVVSNPPYILPSEAHSMHVSVLRHEPSIALFVPAEDPLLFYRPIASYARKALSEGGQLWFEINPRLAREMTALLNAAGFAIVEILNDLSGKARFAKAVQQG